MILDDEDLQRKSLATPSEYTLPIDGTSYQEFVSAERDTFHVMESPPTRVNSADNKKLLQFDDEEKHPSPARNQTANNTIHTQSNVIVSTHQNLLQSPTVTQQHGPVNLREHHEHIVVAHSPHTTTHPTHHIPTAASNNQPAKIADILPTNLPTTAQATIDDSTVLSGKIHSII